MLRIISVNHTIELPDITNLIFNSSFTFLDADILIINPKGLDYLWKKGAARWSDGSLRFQSIDGSDTIRRLFHHRRQEIETLIENGKVIFVFVSPLHTVECQIENRSGRYETITNYSWLPYEPFHVIENYLHKGIGSKFCIKQPSHLISPYYNTFKNKLLYRAYLEGKNVNPKNIFFTNSTENPVGWSYMENRLLFVPPPPEDVDSKKLMGILTQCAKQILTKDFRTPEPEWVKKYTIPGEKESLKNINTLQKEIEGLNKKLASQESELKNLSDYRALLYEQGKPLEDVVLKSLRLMGFKAENFKKDDMEHDVVIESPEGRALAEVEGKDRKAIDIDKLDQLSRIVDEDFHNRGEYSVGLLIGNPYRLVSIEERKDAFTEKVKKAAVRKDFGLLTTIELFKATNKILKNQNDESFKSACRKVILETKGKEIILV